ncbi:hypothetical protein DB345_05040 [Spartobacteria bacterium LR76]|nr:hypothetical protein DB345_05040 [Spartobacteria bacterium LR76]
MLTLRHCLLLAIALALVLADPASVRAQTPTPTPDADTNASDFWTIEFPGGTYVVRIASIVSVSTQEYVVDNAARVVELNISTSGSELLRAYYIEPNVPQAPGGIGQSTVNFAKEKIAEALDRTDTGDVWRKVVKNYPTTTHARTIEYRLASREQVDALFKNLQRALKNGRGGRFKP